GPGDRQRHEERRIERAPVSDERFQDQPGSRQDVARNLLHPDDGLPDHEPREADGGRWQDEAHDSRQALPPRPRGGPGPRRHEITNLATARGALGTDRGDDRHARPARLTSASRADTLRQYSL